MHTERTLLTRDDVGRVVAQTDTEESPTGTDAAAVGVALRCARTTVAVGSATLVVMVAP